MGMFGLGISTSAAAGADPVGDARAAEELGFDFVSASDHPCGSAPTYEVWTILTWVAAATSRIRVATRVLGVPYRSPAMVAKMAETLHRFSGGRLILGLGGGYSDEEFRAFGLGVPSPREKVAGMEEAVQVIRGLWSRPSFTFEGGRYQTFEADLEPKPERPIPIWLGTYGRRALEVTGRLADGWIPSYGFAPPEQVTGLRAQVLAAAGGREVECVYNVPVRIGDVGDAGDDGGVVAGSAEQVTERLGELCGLGFGSMNLMPVGTDFRDQAELLAQKVVPHLR
ncbi:LLM class flavin-dependent oxidoreductase [Nonomuraea roseoviolacea]|uniref:Alkanesulfonate monooxygenase SsuD/methylene tetrahydromethanopterin reductase-like flavin-dependent oxidoreductase (Luciferase family) n=1 Tax=Nonomuraea roseoviolacea subsp. carminata TaxID=160689 RepID=A0ABT1K3Z2_9ACTN|nr:LLM class flavin-dependent oxidoreductase [Nonomuraea roseoviolacea]MCP2348713.1 alkanesulfonate monooxygenase SsuD/methylene tetrahydromethanopterin reductase-like flavin-dependent oxidoreductase (luciferase family) [Nonomuraea roseoviolacea subsp. carminata]